jgi:HEAT repeat protein
MMPSRALRKSKVAQLFGWWLSLAALMPLAAGQEQASLPDRVAAILLEFPADSETGRDAAAAKIIALGPAAVAELCGGLARPGEADDSLVRFALDAVAGYVNRPGAEKERLAFSQNLLRILPEPRDAENMAFLISLLQRVGRAEAARPVSAFLKDRALSGPAARALAAIGGREAEKALLKALPNVPVDSAAAVVQALGGLRSRAAVTLLLRLASGDEPRLPLAALDALAEIGDPAARAALENVAVTAPAEVREGAAPRLLLFARRLAEAKKTRQAEAVCRSFIRNYVEPRESGARASALSLLVEIKGLAALGDLREAARSPVREYRTKALALIEGLKGGWDAAYWIGALNSSPPDVQADILLMLGRVKEKSALGAARERLKSEDLEVREAAIEAAARIGGEAVLDDLVPLFDNADEGEAKVLKEALLSFSADKAVLRASSALAGTTVSAPAKTALLEFLAERQAKDQAEVVIGQTKSEDIKVRTAAISALERVARAQDLEAIVDLLLASTSARETTLLQNALAAAAGQIPEPAGRADPVLAVLAITEGPKRADLVRSLGRVGGPKALEAAIAETKSADPQLQAAAVFTLSNWPDGSALPELWTIAKTTSDRKTRSLAIQGISRLVTASEETPFEKLAGLEEAMAAAVETDQKAAVLAGVSSLRTEGALAFAARYLDDPTLRARAAQAATRIALPAPGFEGLAGLETAALLKKAALFIESDYDRAEVERFANGLLLGEGFIALFNGKNLAGWKGLVADPPMRAKMTAEEMSKAQAEADAEMRRHWRVVEGVLDFDGQGHSLCTLKDYGDFEMFVDWKIEPKGDSGIYLRGSPQVQIWDPAQWPEGSGGLYNNQKNPKNPLAKADRPVGEWNTFYIKMTGERVTVALNGVLVVDNVVMENYWERDKPIYPAGQIELQAHSTPLHFKNIYLREITPSQERD